MTDYNGWKNKETWLVGVWLGDLLRMDQENGILIDADYVESLVMETIHRVELHGGLTSDLLNCALGDIDYREIATLHSGEGS